jgi:TonB-linked SusC/RagA family outer membrane protein
MQFNCNYLPVSLCHTGKPKHCYRVTQMVRIMKLIAILLTVAFLQVRADGFTQATVTFSGKDVALEKVISAIKQQTGYTFFYTMDIWKDAKPVTISVKNATIVQVLNLIMEQQPFSYIIEDKTIIISKKKEQQLAAEQKSNEAPPIDVRGRVVNESGEPVAGASVSIKGTNRGTTTNNNGEFTLKNIEENAVLIISGVNINTIEIKVDGLSDLAVNVKSSITPLEETVIKGYYTTTKRLNTGNVSKVTAETIAKQPVSNPLAALEGRVPGLSIAQQNGLPGSNFIVRVRGQNSITSGNGPMYIVDGVPFSAARAGANGSLNQLGAFGVFDQSPLNNINPSDIESIEILKDADATSIYGSRGSNGVILITTKNGKIGKTKIDLDVNTGIGKVTRKISMLNTEQYLEMRHEAFANDGVMPTVSNAPDLLVWDTTRYTDWQKYLIGGSANITNAHATLSGGNELTQLRLSANYRHETTVFPGDLSDNQSGVSLNINHSSANKKFNASLSAIYSYDKNNLSVRDLTSFIDLPPNAPPVYDSVGKLNWAGNTYNNPFGILAQKLIATTDNLSGNAVLKYEVIPKLQLKVNLGYTSVQFNQVGIYPKSSFMPSTNPVSSSIFGNNWIKTWLAEPQVEYSPNLNKGKLNILLGSTFQNDQTTGYAIRANNYSSDALLETMSGAQTLNLFSTNNTKYRYNAFFGRLSYNLDDKYIVNLTGRRDGSSRFGPGKQFANFGSVGAAWVFSSEKFIQNSFSFLSYGKIRGSYGTSGNDQIGDYQYLNTYSSTAYPYSTTAGVYPTRLFNPDYSWEANRKIEGALELGFLNDKILFTGTYYRNRSSNQLVGLALPGQTGFTTMQANLPALVENKGWEFELNVVSISSNSVKLSTAINVTFPKNKLLSFPDIASSSYAYKYIVGKPLSILPSIHFDGVDPQTGVFSYLDVDNNNQLSYPNDLSTSRVITQKYYGGINNSLKFKEWQLDVFLQFVKQTGRNYLYAIFYPPGFNYNYPEYVLNRWQKPGDNVDFQKFTQSSASPVFNAWNLAHFYGDNSVSDASFIRFKTVSLSYNFPPKLIQKCKLQNIQLYARGQNIFTITNYLGMDPESQNYYSLPPLRIFTAGLNVIF